MDSANMIRMFLLGSLAGFMLRSWLPWFWWHSFHTISFFLFFICVFWLYSKVGR